MTIEEPGGSPGGKKKAEIALELGKLIKKFHSEGHLGRLAEKKGDKEGEPISRGKNYAALKQLYDVLLSNKKLGSKDPVVGRTKAVLDEDQKEFLNSGVRLISDLMGLGFKTAIKDGTELRRLRQRRYVWSLVLAYAWVKSIKPNMLSDFILKKGGIESTRWKYLNYRKKKHL